MNIRPNKSHVVYVAALYAVPAGAVLAFLIHQLSVAESNPSVRCTLLFLGVLGPAVLLMLNAMSEQIELTNNEIARRGLFGTKRMAMSDIVSADMVSGGRGSKFLALRGEQQQLVISNLMFSNAQLGQIQNFVTEAGRRAGRTIPAAQPRSLAAPAGLLLAFAFTGFILAAVLVAALTR